MESLCRVCLKENNSTKETELISLFTIIDDEEETLSSKINKCTSLEISENDVLYPSHICIGCIDNLSTAYSFKIQCEKSDSMLKIYLQYKDATQNRDVPSIHSVNFLEKITEPLKDDAEEDMWDLVPGFDSDQGDEPLKPKTLADVAAEVALSKEKRKKGLRKGRRLQTKRKKSKSVKKEAQKEDEEIVKVKLEKLEFFNEEGEEILTEMEPKVRRRGRPKKVYFDPEGNTLPGKPVSKHVCDQCGKSFKFMDSLRGHLKRHAGDRTHTCSVCGRSFYASNELKKHSLIHSGLKPYKCSYCDKCFRDWGSRFKHERCHRGERPYQCDLCPKTFSYSYVLSRHKLIHTGNKAFSCDICSRDFTLKYHLSNHNRRYHPNLVKTESNTHQNDPNNRPKGPHRVELKEHTSVLQILSEGMLKSKTFDPNKKRMKDATSGHRIVVSKVDNNDRDLIVVLEKE